MASILNQYSAVVVLAGSETAVGAIWSRRFEQTNRGYGFVDEQTPELSIAILPGYRGQGMGTQLMRELLRVMGGRYTAVSLSVSIDNPALRFYHRFGFAEVSRQGNSIVMIKQL
ncbi:MAG: GNAT family N-acetyltransferase [Chloroflexi bacterium]|nr:GNAT family N-acetyltransferase [Chloroflexota bacterium]